MLLREDLADLMPMVNEANAMSEELDRKVIERKKNTVTQGKHSIRYLGPRFWSEIPSKNRLAASLKRFNTQIHSLD